MTGPTCYALNSNEINNGTERQPQHGDGHVNDNDNNKPISSNYEVKKLLKKNEST